MPSTSFPLLDPQTRAAWRAWLAQYHTGTPGVRLVVYKKEFAVASGYLSYDEAVEEALCFGWVDGRTNSRDERSFIQQMTPRRKNSTWAQSNKARVEKLIAQGLMTPAGLKAVEEARQNGSWNALEAAEALVIPPDLLAAFEANPIARQNFESQRISLRKMALAWILSARRPETRQKRIDQVVERAAKNLSLV